MIDFLAAVAVAAAQPDPIASYTLVAPTSVADSGLVARTVLPAGASCPDLVVTRRTSKGLVNKTYAMKARRPAATAKVAFDTVRVCSHNIPTNAVRARIDGKKIQVSVEPDPRDRNSVQIQVRVQPVGEAEALTLELSFSFASGI